MREAPLPAAAAEAPSNDWRSGPIAGFVLAAVGGAIAWAILEWTPPPFTVPEEYHVLGIGAPSEKHAALEAVEVQVKRRNAMVALSWLGGLIAGAIAIGEAFARRSPRAVLLAVPLAAAGGCAAGWIGSLAYEAFGIGPLASLGDTVKAQAPMLGLLGAGVGLALGGSHLSLRGGLALSGAGLLAGLLASLVYPVAVSVLLPTASTDSLIPQGAVNRLVWIGIAAGLLGATVAGAARPRQSRTPGRQREGTKS